MKRFKFYAENVLTEKPRILRIDTVALDHINDNMVFYVDLDNNSISDDGYMRNEFVLNGFEEDNQEVDELCNRIAKHYFCYMDKDELCINFKDVKEFEEKLIMLIQAATAISYEIMRPGGARNDR